MATLYVGIGGLLGVLSRHGLSAAAAAGYALGRAYS
jgi:hypothetical protein